MNLDDFKQKYQQLTEWYDTLGKLKVLDPWLFKPFEPYELAIIRLINTKRLESTYTVGGTLNFVDDRIATKWMNISARFMAYPKISKSSRNIDFKYDLPSLILKHHGVVHTTIRNYNEYLIDSLSNSKSVWTQYKTQTDTHLILDISDKKHVSFTLDSNPITVYDVDGFIFIINNKCGTSKVMQRGVFFLRLFNTHYSGQGDTELTFTEAEFKNISNVDYKNLLNTLYPNALLISQLLLSKLPNIEHMDVFKSKEYDDHVYDTLSVFHEKEILDNAFKRYQLCGSKELLYMDLSGIVHTLKNDQSVELPTL